MNISSHIESKSKRQGETFSLNKNFKFCPVSPTRETLFTETPTRADAAGALYI